MALTRAEVNRILDAAVAKAEELNIKICVAVCDAGGRLMGFSRMDGAIWAAGYGCQGKAIASACFARPSGLLMDRADTPFMKYIGASEGGHMALAQGAVPVVRNGELEGACGAGGGTGQQDEDCSQAGVNAL